MSSSILQFCTLLVLVLNVYGDRAVNCDGDGLNNDSWEKDDGVGGLNLPRRPVTITLPPRNPVATPGPVEKAEPIVVSGQPRSLWAPNPEPSGVIRPISIPAIAQTPAVSKPSEVTLQLPKPGVESIEILEETLRSKPKKQDVLYPTSIPILTVQGLLEEQSLLSPRKEQEVVNPTPILPSITITLPVIPSTELPLPLPTDSIIPDPICGKKRNCYQWFDTEWELALDGYNRCNGRDERRARRYCCMP